MLLKPAVLCCAVLFQVRIAIQTFGAHNLVSCEQLARVLGLLSSEPDRVTAFVSLWSRIIDRDNIYEAYQLLTEEEQRQVSWAWVHGCWAGELGMGA